MLIGFAKDKDYIGSLKEVVGETQFLHLIQANHVRAMSLSKLNKATDEVEPISQYSTKCST